MFSLPPLPRWDAVHPIIVHFPLGLLLTAPVLIVLAMLFKRRSAGLLIGAWAMIAAGTVFLVVALMSGEATEDAAEKVAAAENVLHRHEELAESARNAFAVLAVLISAWAFIAVRAGDLMPRRVLVIGSAVYLVLHLAASLILVNTAHQGGRLVHELGVRAPMAAAPDQAGSPVSQSEGEHDDDD